MAFIDGTVVNVALPALQSSLHATVVDVQWVIEAYGLFLSALILVGGALGGSDFTGAKFDNANLSGSDFATAKGLNQVQLNTACGDAATKLPHLKLVMDSAATAATVFPTNPAMQESYNEYASIFGRAMLKLQSSQDATADVMANLQKELERAIPLK